MGAWGMWACSLFCSLFYSSLNWNSHTKNFDCVNSWNFTKSPPKFSAYVYCINPWEAAWMVVYIIVFILGSIHLKQSLLELIQNNRWLNLYLCPSSHWKITLCLYRLKQLNLSTVTCIQRIFLNMPHHVTNTMKLKDVLYMTVCYNLVILI